MKLDRKVTVPAAFLGVGALGVLVIWALRPTAEAGSPRVVAPLVRVVEALPRDVQFSVRTQGTVVPRTESDLVPHISGEVIWVSPNLASGGFFEENEPLVRIDPGDFRVDVEAARAAVARRESEFARAKTELDRQRSLAVEGVASQTRIDDAENANRVSEAELREEKAKLSRAERNLVRTELRAPYEGRVRSEAVDVGQFVNRGAPIATLYATDFAEVRLPLPDRELFYLDIPLHLSGAGQRDTNGDGAKMQGPEVRLTAEFAGEPRLWIGRIVRTEGEIDPKSRMLNLVARVKDPYGRSGARDHAPLAVGMFVEAEILGRKVERVFVLPREALRTDGADDLVYVVDAENRLRFRRVEVLRTERYDAVLKSGLSPFERVSVSPLVAAVDGMLVRVAATPGTERHVDLEPVGLGGVGGTGPSVVQAPR
jgi:RND family efflux transporter MFP subunit